MEFQIYFCADGILRAKFSEDKPMIPVKFLQENSPFHDNDLRFWTRWWESYVYFEEGLTVSKFLFCLEPWADFWTDITGKDIRAYIKEARRPLVVKGKDDDDFQLDWVSISYYTEVEADTEYQKEDDELFEKDMEAWFNSPKNTRLTGKWAIHSSYKVTGFIKGQEEQYSVDYTPMNKLANLPLILNDKQWLYFSDWQVKRILGKKTDHVFKKNAFGICKISENDIKFLIGDKHHRMREVVEGFFWWMYVNPVRREEFINEIKETKEEFDSLKEESSIRTKEEENNIVNLFDSEQESLTTSENAEEKKLEVKVASGAFDSLIKGFEQDKQYWEDMLELASTKNNVVLKIGKAELNKAPEERVFSYIIDPNDKNANPQCSYFKKV